MKEEIIIENKIFKIINFEEGNVPSKIAVRFPNPNHQSLCNMVNGIDVILQAPYNFNAPTNACFKYKNLCLEERNVGTKASFCEILNFYNNLDEDQLNKKLIEVQQGIKSDLEIEIEKLNETKKKLIETNDKLINLFEKFNKEVSIIIDDFK
jgi:hypothetical protein